MQQNGLRRKTMSENGQEYTMEKGTYRVVDGELVRIVDIDEVEKMLALHKDILISKGWTPPPTEPEFKAGDYVEVWDYESERRVIDEYAEYLHESSYPHKTNRNSWRHCRHAPTWIKWESGPVPYNEGPIIVQWENNTYGISNGVSTIEKLLVKRWAWI